MSCLLSCTDTADSGPDTAPDSSVPDAASTDAAAVDPGPCEPDKLWNFIADRPIAVGDYCDDIQMCASSAEVAEAIETIEPGFVCAEAPAFSGCAPGLMHCEWFDPDEVDGAEYARLCAITKLESAPDLLTCMVYL